MAYKLLIVEDEKLLADSIRTLLQKKGFDVEVAYDGETEEKDMRKPPQSSRILLLRISECLKWTDWK